VTGAEFWTELAITVLIDSNLASKLLSAVTKQVFTRVIRSNALFQILPKSELGKALAAAATDVEEIVGRATARSVIKEGLANLPGTASKEALKLYSPTLQVFATQARKLSGLDYSKAAVKVANQARQAKNRPRSNRPLGAPDSAGVAVLHSALEYAAATRLGIRFSHAGIERAVWTTPIFDDLLAILSVVDWDDLTDADERDAFSGGLTLLRSRPHGSSRR
jgi:hypothetical protein